MEKDKKSGAQDKLKSEDDLTSILIQHSVNKIWDEYDKDGSG